MDINYYMKIQNAYGTKNRREKELIKINNEMTRHFSDTFNTEEVLLNDVPTQLMIIKDTDGNTFKKKIKSVHGNKFNLGDYVKWNGQMWLITLVDVDEKTWNRGYMYLCTVPLRWQNSKGKIIERYVYSEDFTKYSNGTTGNNTITIGDNQYGLTVPVDSETKKLKRDMRFPIDFDDSEQPDIYKITNRKVKLNDNQYFGRGATMILTMSFDAFNPNNDKKIAMENGQKVWICNYNSSLSPLPPSLSDPDETGPTVENNNDDLLIKIVYEDDAYILAGGDYKIFKPSITDRNGNSVIVPVEWKVDSFTDINKYVHYEILDDNSLKIKSEYHKSVIGAKILLRVSITSNSNINDLLHVVIGGGI